MPLHFLDLGLPIPSPGAEAMVGLGSCSSHIGRVGLEVVWYDGQFSLVPASEMSPYFFLHSGQMSQGTVVIYRDTRGLRRHKPSLCFPKKLHHLRRLSGGRYYPGQWVMGEGAAVSGEKS